MNKKLTEAIDQLRVVLGEQKEFPQLEKDQAGYIEPYKHDGQTGTVKCAECNQFKTKGGCVSVEGKISPDGSCNLFKPGKADSFKDWQDKIPQSTAVYVVSKDGFTCKKCKAFENKQCLFVKGSISPDACCNLWQHK